LDQSLLFSTHNVRKGLLERSPSEITKLSLNSRQFIYTGKIAQLISNNQSAAGSLVSTAWRILKLLFGLTMVIAYIESSH